MFLRSSFSGVHMPTLAQENNYLKNVNCTENNMPKENKKIRSTYLHFEKTNKNEYRAKS